MSHNLAPYTVSRGLLERPEMLDALRSRDFQSVFTLARKYDGASQERIASVVEGLTQGRVSRVMSGRDRLASLDLIERLADGLRIPGELLGLAPRTWESKQTSGLIVEAEYAELRFDGNDYHVTIRRTLRNVGTEPVTRYLIRIAVDRYPDDPKRSGELYRDNPLSFQSLRLSAQRGSESMDLETRYDRDTFKEVWLLFRNSKRQFPLYPGQTSTIDYTYQVNKELWGSWFQRAIRIPTQNLSIRLIFPISHSIFLWGTRTSITDETSALPTAIRAERDEISQIFTWSTDDPQIQALYRIEWRIKSVEPQEGKVLVPARTRMVTSAGGSRIDHAWCESHGILQRGDEGLRRIAYDYSFPRDINKAAKTVERLRKVIDAAEKIHLFSKGSGLSAVQIGVEEAAAIVRSNESEELVLLNPRVTFEESTEDEQYEGCLSFFEYRGLLRRSLTVHVEYVSMKGEKQVSVLERALARLVMHEIDHLRGTLYIDRMPRNAALIDAVDYPGCDSPWKYGAT